MTREEKIDYIVDYFNQHFKFQKFVYGWEISRELIEKLTDEQLEEFIKKNCK